MKKWMIVSAGAALLGLLAATAPQTVGGIGGAVQSVFGRSGAVTAANGDYSFAQLAGSLASGQLPATFTAPLATALAATPTRCSAGSFPLGVDTGGNAVNCTAAGGSSYTAVTWASGEPASSNAPAAATNGVLSLWGKEIPYPVTFSNIAFDVQALDATNSYSVGIYGPLSGCTTTCALVASTAAASYGTGGGKDVAATQGTVTLVPGVYFFALTGNAATLSLAVIGPNLSIAPLLYYTASGGSSSGGAMPATITKPVPALQFAISGVNSTPRMPFLYLSSY